MRYKLQIDPFDGQPARVERYLPYFSRRKFSRELFLHITFSRRLSLPERAQVFNFNASNICMHAGLNGGCPDGHPRRSTTEGVEVFLKTGRCHNSERVMFGSYNPEHEVFLDPCPLQRVKYICKKQDVPLKDDYSLNPNGKIIFCLNGAGGWYSGLCPPAPNQFNPAKAEQLKGYADKIAKYTKNEIEFRLHPKDSEKLQYRNIFSQLGLKILDQRHHDAMENAACLVVDHTTMVFEAAVRGVPVFYLGDNPKSCIGNDYFLKKYKLFDFDNIDEDKLPDRFSFLRKYFSGILLTKELEGGVKLPEFIDEYLTKYP